MKFLIAPPPLSKEELCFVHQVEKMPNQPRYCLFNMSLSEKLQEAVTMLIQGRKNPRGGKGADSARHIKYHRGRWTEIKEYLY